MDYNKVQIFFPLKVVQVLRRLYLDFSVSPIDIGEDKNIEDIADLYFSAFFDFAKMKIPNVVLDKRDVWVKELDDGDLFIRNIRAYKIYWDPQTKVCSLEGGPGDGKIVAVTDLWSPLAVVTEGPISIADLDGKPEELSFDTKEYYLAGWDATKRVWIFR